MRYDNLRAFQKHVQDSAILQLPYLYLVVSKEEFERKLALDFLLAVLLPPEKKKYTALTHVDASQIDVYRLEEELYNGSLFFPIRVLHLYQADKLKKNAQELFIHYLQQTPFSQQFLVLSSLVSPVKNSIFYKTIEKQGSILEFAESKPWDKEKRFIEWMQQYVARQHKVISVATCQKLVQQIGQDAHFIMQELEKVICYTGERKEITAEDIEKISYTLSFESIWHLAEAIFTRNFSQAIEIARAQLKEKQSILPLLRYLRSQLQIKLHLALLDGQGKPIEEIVKQYPQLKGPFFHKHLQQAKDYGPNACIKGLTLIDQIEQKIKHFATSEVLLLDTLIIQLTVD